MPSYEDHVSEPQQWPYNNNHTGRACSVCPVCAPNFVSSSTNHADDEGAAGSLIAQLRSGNERFLKNQPKPKGNPAERERLAREGQTPQFAILGCADSRVPPELLFDMDAGELFNVRVAGNVVTPEVAASLEYAVAQCKVKMLFVLGHTKCGAVAAAKSGQSFPGNIPSLVQRILPACGHENAEAENVRLQMKILKKKFANIEDVYITGGMYNIESGEVEFFPTIL